MSFIFSILFLLNFNVHADEVKTISSLDVNKYLGQWYEIASIPQKFQRMCDKNSQANYELKENGKIKVLNSCTKEDGQVHDADAEAYVVSLDEPGKLKVTFVKIINWIYSFGGNYWILDLGENYSYSVIGDPTREYGWILSRERSLSDKDLLKINDVLLKNSYDTCRFNLTIQDDGNQERIKLCDYIKKVGR